MRSRFCRKFFRIGLCMSFLILSTQFLAACQRMVEKEKMEAIGQWSISMCKCAEKDDAAEAKSCAKALTKPPNLELLNSGGHTQYKIESVHAYDDIEEQGFQCQMKIETR